jgi:hypothetical protein
MRSRIRWIWGSAKFCLCIVALAFGMLFLTGDYHPAGATSTEIVPSVSDTSATWMPFIVLVKGASAGGISPCDPAEADARTGCLYVWAKNVDNSTGASAFQVKATYDSNMIKVDNIAHMTTWLGSTGRSVACGTNEVTEDLQTGSGFALTACNTLLPPPPYGPNCANGNCTGQLALIAFRSKSTIGSTTLDFSQSFLVDTPSNPSNQQQIPATVHSVNITVAPCADFTGDGGVPDGQVLIEDIVHVVDKYFSTDGPSDLNGDGQVLIDDVVIAVQEYFAFCTR